jgi:tetratricopeptide (TPR) repeat protein
MKIRIAGLSAAVLALGFCLLDRAPAQNRRGAAGPQSAAAAGVRMWEEDTVIPTYLIGDPEPNPIFYFGRQSQGAQGRVYPYPLYDNLTYKKTDKKYRIVYLENEYIRIAVLPEVGGRLFEGLDKTNHYNFIYRQHVIKPALIGLIGAWISGGIEWNIPHHHRATSALPVQYRLEANADGSKTIWVGELEMRSRMRWAVGYTLHPGKAYLDASLRILNRTPVVETMLCFANLAVHANENYQVLFPPGTQYGTYHSKREFTEWPIARGRYNGADFTKGVDVSWYKNHISSNSIFAWNYTDDFFAGYDHGKNAGTMSVADHHIVPGKKLWTWGNGPAGRQWDHILTDDDGPYIELMVGAYSDNQPDYSWLQPYETKSFHMYWYPFRDIGGVKKANLDAAVNLDAAGGTATFGFYTTAAHPSATVTLKAGGQVLSEEKVAIGPAKPYTKTVPVPPGTDEHDLRASITVDGRELVAYSPVRIKPEPMPKAVQPFGPPADMETVEELYLAGLRTEQFHAPGQDPLAYWQEALRRDPGDSRVNTVMGINYFKKARFAEAEQFFRKALDRAADRYTTPKDAEATYYLGLTLKAQRRFDEACETLYKATWNMAWRAAAYYETAEIAAMRGDYAPAAGLVDRSLEANAMNLRALTLKAAVLRHLGRGKEALEVLATAHRLTDPLDARLMAERWLLTRSATDLQAMNAAFKRFPATAEETAAEYLHAGLWKDGTDVLAQASPVSPVTSYYLAYFAAKMGDAAKASEYRAQAARMSPDYVFPFQYEAIDVLRAAIEANGRDARAPYYLGNLLYDWQPEAAQRYWEQSEALDGSFAIVHRNLALAYLHGSGGTERAIGELEKAVALERKYPLHFKELDELFEATAVDPAKRLALLEQNHRVVAQRDDSLAREISLKVALGRYDEAITLLTGHRFAVWEGTNLNVADDWANAHLLRGREHLAAKQYGEALTDFETAVRIPDNLPSAGRGGAGHAAEAAYWMGMALEGAGSAEKAKEAFTRASAGGESRGGRGGRGGMFFDPAQSFYRGLALKKLGRGDEAKTIFEGLLRTSAAGAGANRNRLLMAHYAAGLGNLGVGRTDEAKRELQAALAIDPAHVGVRGPLPAPRSPRPPAAAPGPQAGRAGPGGPAQTGGSAPLRYFTNR